MKPNARRVSTTSSIPAPTGGLNAKDAISNMKETEAPIMVNWFPTPSDVQIRNGYRSYTTGMSSVETLMGYNDGLSQKLFAAASSAIYDCSTEGVLPVPSVTGLSNTKLQHITMGTVGGYFLMAVNGEDKLKYYDGSLWSNDGSVYTITGVDSSNIIHINNFKNRVFLIEKDSLSAWYLPVASIAGAALELNLSGLFKLGGYLTCMANWTIDNAAGIDDYAAFITSEGEVAIYQGTDPSDVNAWALKGTFRIGKPIGRRCAIKAGADVLLLTADGAFPLSKALLTDRGQLSQAITDKISNLILSDIRSYQNIFGWQPIIHPLGSKLIINVPQTTGMAHQYVMNTQTGAWTKFTNWNAVCWELLDDVLYFGASDGIYIADTGTDDNGADIECDVQQAFSYFGDKGSIKRFTMVRPIFLAEGDITPALVMNVDYEQRVPLGSPSFSGSAGAEWDLATWDVDAWGAGDTINKKWQSVTGVGYSGGVRIKTTTQGIGCRWQATQVVYESGGVL
jgi:hypothetical protein